MKKKYRMKHDCVIAEQDFENGGAWAVEPPGGGWLFYLGGAPFHQFFELVEEEGTDCARCGAPENWAMSQEALDHHLGEVRGAVGVKDGESLLCRIKELVEKETKLAALEDDVDRLQKSNDMIRDICKPPEGINIYYRVRQLVDTEKAVGIIRLDNDRKDKALNKIRTACRARDGQGIRERCEQLVETENQCVKLIAENDRLEEENERLRGIAEIELFRCSTCGMEFPSAISRDCHQSQCEASTPGYICHLCCHGLPCELGKIATSANTCGSLKREFGDSDILPKAEITAKDSVRILDGIKKVEKSIILINEWLDEDWKDLNKTKQRFCNLRETMNSHMQETTGLRDRLLELTERVGALESKER